MRYTFCYIKRGLIKSLKENTISSKQYREYLNTKYDNYRDQVYETNAVIGNYRWCIWDNLFSVEHKPQIYIRNDVDAEYYTKEKNLEHTNYNGALLIYLRD